MGVVRVWEPAQAGPEAGEITGKGLRLAGFCSRLLAHPASVTRAVLLGSLLGEKCLSLAVGDFM